MKKMILTTIMMIIIDQISKLVVRTFLSLFETVTIIPSFLNITYVQNTGAAFSILEGKQWIFVLASLIVLVGIIYYLKNRTLSKVDVIIFSLLMSGIIGNLIDRIFFHYVTDFIEFIILGKYMPIFNLADTFICVGCVLLIFKEEICKHLNTRKKKANE